MTERLEAASSSSAPAGEPDPTTVAPSIAPDDQALERVRALCPYLIAGDGDWRSVTPTREHRCAAVDPWSPLAPDKQRRLCLVAGHVECATFLAACRVLVPGDVPATGDGESPDLAGPGAIAPDGAGSDAAAGSPRVAPAATVAGRQPPGRWPVPATAPVLLGRSRGGLTALRVDRSLAQAGLVALMVLAFVVLAVARLSGDDGLPPVASPSPVATIGASPSPGGSAAPTATRSPAASASPIVSPASSSGASPAPSTSATAPTTYRVRSGDTLTAIAARFGTTAAVLAELNAIADPGSIRVGQVIRLP